MHTYRRIVSEDGTLYTVGFFDATIGWHALRDCSSEAEAINLVSHLNGGPGTSLVLQALATLLGMACGAGWVRGKTIEHVEKLQVQLASLIRLVDQHKPGGP